ncbi:MAG: DNA mismatch repair protein MutS, partial [Candidatus Fonsibacter sp.]
MIDKTVTPPGSRLMKRWLALPLKHIEPIKERQLIVNYFYQNIEIAQYIQDLCKQVGDLERLISKVAVSRANPRDINQLKKSLQALVPIKDVCLNSELTQLNYLADQINTCNSIRERI